MAHYNLIFQGKIIDGASLDEVKSNVARLFKADAAKTAALFSGKTIVIKKNLDTEAAKKYLAVMKKAGAIIRAVKIEDDSASTSPPPNDTAANNDAPTQASPGDLSAGLASLVSYNKPKEQLSANDNSNSEGLQLAPAGSDILNQSPSDDTAEIPDTSHITMSKAETGSLEEFTQKIAAVELPDIESLTMSEASTGSMEEFSIGVAPVDLPDISDLDLAGQDSTPLSAETPKPAPVDLPDTSELSMSGPQEGTLEGIEIKADPVKIPDISHIEVEKPEEKTDVKKSISGKATFQIN